MDWLIWGYRQVFCCKRKIQKLLFNESKQESISIADLPWLWLVFVNSEGQTIVATHIVNDILSKLHSEVHVTPQYLTSITGFSRGTWRYIDAKTLEDNDFPSEGFIIRKCQK